MGHTLTPTPAARPGHVLRRGRSKARAPVARERCGFAPRGEGLDMPVLENCRSLRPIWATDPGACSRQRTCKRLTAFAR
ncbi:hypothetical protein XarbCFBP7610_12715 [Xanthomonas arboricola]|nr:hypothetical protein XarbCFBP7610_12715 [Xanthomonas arboricola]